MTEIESFRTMTNGGGLGVAGDTAARRYRIIVSSRLGMACCEAFRDLQIEPHGPHTALTGDLNRSGLHGVLTLIRDLALEVVGLTCLAPEPLARASHRV